MEQKDAYVQKQEARLNEWSAEIDKLKAKAQGASADAKIEYEKQLDRLRTQRQTLQERLQDIRKAGKDAWSDLKAGAESAANEMKTALDSARQKFQ